MYDNLILHKNSEILWAIDAGHGNNTKGKRSRVWSDGSILYEYEYNRAIRDKLVKLMDLYNMSYYIVNPEDTDISLSERVNRINGLKKITDKYVITVSIHGNAAGTEKANGYEIYTSPGSTTSDKIADIFYKHADRTNLFKMRYDFTDGDYDKEANFKKHQ